VIVLNKGKFFVIEGIDGSGKTYQSEAFANMLRKQKVDVVLTEEPWYTDRTGKMIKEALHDQKESLDISTLQLLYIANRSNHVENVIKPALDEGKTVVCSRYWMSTVVYGIAFGNDPNLNMEYYIRINEIFPKPTAVFYIDVNPQEAYRRITSERGVVDLFEKLEKIEKQYAMYSKLEQVLKPHGVWINIDGNKEKDAVTAQIMDGYNSIK
jgi:dTMP kinase